MSRTYPIAGIAVPMLILVVVVQFLEVVEMVITPPTVRVARALDVMLNEANRGREVPIAGVADVVHRRVVPVLL